ncbi:MAG: hypothetical protein ABIQ60_00215 [Burkholderiaceae bacterium]
MSDEFDDPAWPCGCPLRSGRAQARVDRRHDTIARLISRLYRSADDSVRARTLACLLRPLGTLSLAAVAAGAFGRYIGQGRGVDQPIDLVGAVTHSREQIMELARFVHQVNPQVIEQVTDLMAENALGMAAFSASVAVLLYRRLRPQDAVAPNDGAGLRVQREEVPGSQR